MNAIEKDFRSEMSQIETERLDEELPKILAGKMEAFMFWLQYGKSHILYELDDDGKMYDVNILYAYWLDNVDGK